jgi:hypothetical protein
MCFSDAGCACYKQSHRLLFMLLLRRQYAVAKGSKHIQQTLALFTIIKMLSMLFIINFVRLVHLSIQPNTKTPAQASIKACNYLLRRDQVRQKIINPCRKTHKHTVPSLGLMPAASKSTVQRSSVVRPVTLTASNNID